jgi:hypothetical protein
VTGKRRDTGPITPYADDIAALTDADWLPESEVAGLRPVHVDEDAKTLPALARTVLDFYQWRIDKARVCTADGLLIGARFDRTVDAMATLGWIEMRGSSGFVHWDKFSRWTDTQGAYPNAFMLRRWIAEHPKTVLNEHAAQ